MNWKQKLRNLELIEEWDYAIIFMEKIIQENPNDMDAYIIMNYLLMNLLVEEDYDDSKHDHYALLAKNYFDESYKKFSNNLEYLFFTGMTAYMSEWYFGIEIEDAQRMIDKAFLSEPTNLLFEWGCNPGKERGLAISRQILQENSPEHKQLKSKGAVGECLLSIMKYKIEHPQY